MAEWLGLWEYLLRVDGKTTAYSLIFIAVMTLFELWIPAEERQGWRGRLRNIIYLIIFKVAGLASIAVLEEEKLPERAARVGALALARLRRRFEGQAGVVDVRGRGLLLAVECAEASQVEALFRRGLERGIISLPSGDEGRSLSLAPPLTIAEPVLEDAIDRLAEGLS